MKGIRCVLIAGLAALVFILPSCGKKAPPFLPQKGLDARVTEMKGEWDGEVFVLKGRIDDPRGAEGTGERIRGCRVYFAQYPLGHPPCPGCPVEYQGYHGFGPEVLAGEDFRCPLPGKRKGQVYFFEVVLIGGEGSTGPPSERIRVDLK
ncbi:MAG: hypothetical protein JW821_03535 [Deltaproteobacteria bacterium]|nr:hypothetical protein [Deltaproteobacteria bacterium]